MYEDSWYNFVPEVNKLQASAAPTSHRRKESTLLQQPNGITGDNAASQKPLAIVNDAEEENGPPEPTVPRRAASYSDLKRSEPRQAISKKTTRQDRAWEALLIRHDSNYVDDLSNDVSILDAFDDELLEASQDSYLLYRDQLLLTERHLDGLIDDANTTLELLTKLSLSFQSVDDQTSTFQAQCEELLTEQHRLEKLSGEVENDLRYYAYLETASRRLNAPGASRLVDDSSFADMMEEIDSCISFMTFHEDYRERDSYLARYNALLAKALHLLDVGFTSHIEKVSSDISRQISASKTQSTWHALAYGRFEEMMMDSYSLVPNIQRIIETSYDQYGTRATGAVDTALYVNTANNLMRTYLTTRDRDLKQLTQHDISEYQKEAKELSVETASRNFIKQVFERVQNEGALFNKIFNMSLVWNMAPESAFQVAKDIQTSMAHPANMTPLATQLQAVLQPAELKSLCNVVGWIAGEYSILEADEDETELAKKLREYAARLLVDHLWPFTDAAFETEVTKAITKAAMDDSSLTIGPVVDGIAWSNAYPVTKKAIELLSMFDQAMPKERSTKNSPVIFKIVRETIQVLQRAEARIRSLKLATDADLFTVKNLLILKNELVSLEIGDIRSNKPASMQHFTQIWETLSPQNLAGFIGSMLPSRLWGGGTTGVTAKTLTVEDMSEQLDELLRQSIYAFTKRWGALVSETRSGKGKGKQQSDVEGDLDDLLRTAFSGQPEVMAKLKEAIEMNAAAQSESKNTKK